MPRIGRSFDFLDEYNNLKDRVRRLELRNLDSGRGADIGWFSYLPSNSWLSSGWAIDLFSPPQVMMYVYGPEDIGGAWCRWSGNIYNSGGTNLRTPFADLPGELEPATYGNVLKTALLKAYDDPTNVTQPSINLEGIELRLVSGGNKLYRDAEINTGFGPSYSLSLLNYSCSGFPRDDPARWEGAAWSWEGAP